MDTNRKRNYFVDFLAISFGVSAWAGITGTLLQMPQIVQTAPEGWNLPSYIVILTQSGNIASLVYIIYEKWSSVKFDDANLIYLTLGIGCLAAILMAFFYRTTINIGGEERSIPLLIFTGMFAIVGCVSSVLFMPFMGRFRGIYLVTYMFGQGLNGLLTSTLSLMQGVGMPVCVKNNITNETTVQYSEPLFEPKIYFLCIFALLVMSSLAFVLLNTMNTCNKEYASAVEKKDTHDSGTGNGQASGYQAISTSESTLSSSNFYYLMIVLGVISSLTNGILPGLQSYSCMPYGSSAYHLSTTFSSIANPLACLFSLYTSRPAVHRITVMFIITAIFSVYIVITAVESPTPPFHTLAIGSYLIIIVWTMFTALTSLIKLEVLQLFRRNGHNALKWAGAFIQFGSCIGAVFAFALVNKTNIFTAVKPCQSHDDNYDVIQLWIANTTAIP
ncbi:riboflavin transporter 2-like [Sitodiplosis mosellana]|uniref:riboflavin transporter 2-like n=1 Tax=Sitodiplosis mosellana TaxID=263140 RepID=UPI00244522CC|nr:riboflavin transporter 2-like [Sitodiplosis mosellana]